MNRETVKRCLLCFSEDEGYVDEVWADLKTEMEKYNTTECTAEYYSNIIDEFDNRMVIYQRKDIPEILYCGILKGNNWYLCNMRDLEDKGVLSSRIKY